MEVRYKRDLNSNYMILGGDGIEDGGYELRMVSQNGVTGVWR